MKTFNLEATSGRISFEAYEDVDGIIRWTEVDRVVPQDVLRHNAISEEVIARCRVVEQQETQEFLEEYKRRQENHKPSLEEMNSMLAAFGPGVTVVNVITGRETKL